MSLADALEREAVTSKGPRCAMCQLVDELPEADRAVLVTALADHRYTGAAITRALRAEGHQIAAPTVTRHRKGDCLGDR